MTVRARCRAIPSLATFVESVAPDADPDAFWRCTDPFLRLLDSSFLADLAAWELDRLRADADYAPSAGNGVDLEVLRLGNIVLMVRLQLPHQQPAPEHIVGSCEHHLTANAGTVPVVIERWRQGWDGPSNVLDRSRALEPVAPTVLAPGQHVRLEAHRDVARLGDHREASIGLVLTRILVTRVRWVYDATTLLPVHAESADTTASRLEYAVGLLAALNHVDAVPAIAALYDHPDHFVRWSAVRRVMLLDPAAGMVLLRQATSDPHPHVRRVALRSLETLDAPPQPTLGRTDGTYARS